MSAYISCTSEAGMCQRSTAIDMNRGNANDSSLQVLQTFLSLYTTDAFAAHEMQSDTAFRGNKLSGKGCAEPIRIEHSVHLKSTCIYSNVNFQTWF